MKSRRRRARLIMKGDMEKINPKLNTMEKKELNKVVAGVADAASGQMVKQAGKATGWKKVAWIIGAAIAGALSWLLGAGQVQPDVGAPASPVEAAAGGDEVLPE